VIFIRNHFQLIYLDHINIYLEHSILKKEIDTNLRNLISELEDGLRFFFLNHHLSTTEIKGSKVINVDLNTIFNDVTNNKYRMLLLEYIDDDFVFLLEYLMILSPGGNIRNDVMHGIMPPEEMNSYKCWYAALLIIKLYIGFHCCSLEENNI